MNKVKIKDTSDITYEEWMKWKVFGIFPQSKIDEMSEKVKEKIDEEIFKQLENDYKI